VVRVDGPAVFAVASERRTASPRRGAVSGDAKGHVRRWPALAVLCVSILVVNLDNTILNVALPTLVR
jgi:hypothetical protein